ncbi:MAG: hypothetical protein H6837_15790 [Planctomycetes bacterium]|nr:hypothetical protein [Planctomycetota bacterium]
MNTTIRVAPLPHGVPADAGAPELPPSKSHAQRALCLAAFLPGDITVEGVPDGRDAAVLQRALVNWRAGPVDLEDNGTALRVLSVLVPLAGEACVLHGHARLRARGAAASLAFLRSCGALVDEGWPLRVDGRGVAWPSTLEVDARHTTQTASGVLLGAGVRLARASEPRCVVIRAPTAPGYLAVTVEVLRTFGFAVALEEEGADLRVELHGYTAPVGEQRYRVPADPSSAVFVRTLLAMHGMSAPMDAAPTAHPDARFDEDVQRLCGAAPGAEVELEGLRSRPDGFPCLAALAALRPGRTVLAGAPALRDKESDRIAAMARALEALGATCRELPDGLVVDGPLPEAHGAIRVPAPPDHRVVMAVALLGTRLPHGLEVENPEAVAKSWPRFFDWLGRVAVVERPDGPRATW